MENMIGWTATTITLIYTGMGLPMQIRTMIKQRSAHGLNLFMTVMLFLTMSSWTAYGAVSRDYYIMIPNICGMLGAGTLLLLFWMYRNNPQPETVCE